MLALFAVGTLLAADSGPPCTHEIVRTAKSEYGAEAFEENRICSVNVFATTGHNEIFLRKSRRAERVLVARLESVGRIGVPLSWKGRTLVIHLPTQYRRSFVQVLRPRVGDVSVAIVNDYPNEAQLRDDAR
jgi:hypothetical protein